jgi:hypothetical protein
MAVRWRPVLRPRIIARNDFRHALTQVWQRALVDFKRRDDSS